MKELKKLKILVLLLIWISVGFQLPGESLAKMNSMSGDLKSQTKTLDKLFQVSGLNNRYQDMEFFLDQSENIQPEELEASQAEFARNLMRRGLDRGGIRSSLKQTFISRFNQEQAEVSIKWFDSRIGRVILKAENEATSPENKKEREMFLKNVMNAPPSESRLLAVERIEASGAMSANAKSLYLAYVEIMFPFNKKMEGRRLVKVFGMLKDEIVEPIREQVLRQRLFAYRNISERDLKAYADFLESRAGQWLVFSELNGFAKGIKKALKRAKKVQKEILIEIGAGGPEFPLVREIAPPGQRYLLIRLRDPFKPLFTNMGPDVQVAEASPANRIRQFGGELEDIPPIALYVLKKIEKSKAGLFKELKHYERLFNNREGLKNMTDDEYADAIDAYRSILERASSTKVSQTPLQAEYETLRLTGIISKKSETLAMIETVDSGGHAVRKGDIIGPRFGSVDEIQAERIIVIEKSRDYLGNVLTRQKTIEFSENNLEEDRRNL